MKRLLVFTICLFGLGLAASANAADFYLSPSSDQFTTDCEESVDIMIDSEGDTTDAANIYVYYDPAEVEIVDKDAFTDGTQIQTGDAYQIYLDNIASGGEIRLTGFTVFGGFSGVKTFGTIVLKGLAGVSQTDLSIYYVAGSTLDSNIAEKDTALDLLDGVNSGHYTFTTGYCTPDTTPPWVSDASPYSGQTDYPLDGKVNFNLKDNRSGVDLDSIKITVDGLDYSLAGPNTFSYSGLPLDYAITVDPIVDFPAEAQVTTSVYACDEDGNCRTTTWSFNAPVPPPPPPPTCEELYATCEGWYSEYECVFEGYECPPGGCQPCEECLETGGAAACEPEIVYVTEPCPGEAVTIPKGVVSEAATVYLQDETIFVPEVSVEPDEMISRSAVSIYALHGRLPLPVDPFGKFYILPGFDYTVDLDATVLSKTVSSVQWFAANSRYAMAHSADFYTANLTAPAEPAAYPAHIIISYEDGTVDRLDYTVIVAPPGRVTGKDENGKMAALAGAEVSLIDAATGEPWNAAAYLQDNPTKTDEQGRYGFLVPAGEYRVVFSKEGYRESGEDFYTIEIVNTSDELILIPGPVTGIGDIVDWFNYFRALSGELGVQLAIILLMLILLLLSLLNAFLLRRELGRGAWPLFLMFRHPHEFFRGEHHSGVVFNSVSKAPVAHARLRLIDGATGKWLRTAITDQWGRFKFFAETGRYRIAADRPGFVSPSGYLSNMNLGEEMRIGGRVDVLEPNTPVDPEVPQGSARRIVFAYHGKRLEHAFVIFAVWASLIGLLLAPIAFVLSVFAFELAVWAVIRNARKDMGKVKALSIIRNGLTGRSVGNAVVRLFDPRYEKALAVSVTNRRGRFGMLVGPGEYYLTVERGGFEKEVVKGIRVKDRETIIEREIKLQRKK
ncbi:carboxypeptidase-like regulatory domain-containing protein [Patescibacteria group bacterium]|nr:carboxypeptidase-like regulatory domain-containing protein [Patescibacteria group bacterium]MBU1907173.1 carboxypeptidase-like regulatory domain-containing protein [Patescibacteria group bacterium]